MADRRYTGELDPARFECETNHLIRYGVKWGLNDIAAITPGSIGRGSYGSFGRVTSARGEVLAGIKIYEAAGAYAELSARREYDALRKLDGAGGVVPRPLMLGTYYTAPTRDVKAAGISHPALVMDVMPGDTLFNVIDEGLVSGSKGDLPTSDQTLRMARAVARAIAAFHAASKSGVVVHRDLSYTNVFFDPVTWSSYIIDFGQSAEIKGVVTSPARGLLGTPPFAAPEMFDGKTMTPVKGGVLYNFRNEPTVDIWSFGALVYFIRTGEVPHQNVFLSDDERNLGNAELVELKHYANVSICEALVRQGKSITALDRKLDALVRSCTAFDPADRPQSMDRVIEQLDGIKDAKSGSASDDTDVPIQTPPYTGGGKTSGQQGDSSSGSSSNPPLWGGGPLFGDDDLSGDETTIDFDALLNELLGDQDGDEYEDDLDPWGPLFGNDDKDSKPGSGSGAATKPKGTKGSDPYAGVRPNDLCPCGSGKKFKKCHGLTRGTGTDAGTKPSGSSGSKPQGILSPRPRTELQINEEKAIVGDKKAMLWLAENHLEGTNGVLRSVEKALSWYHMAAEAGSVDAQLALGRMYQNGTYVTKDLSEARSWYRKAAAGGSTEAKRLLTNLQSRTMHKVTFKDGAGGKVFPDRVVEVEHGRLITDPVDIHAERFGYEPKGWSPSMTYSKTATADATYTMQWKRKPWWFDKPSEFIPVLVGIASLGATIGAMISMG